MIVKKIPSKEIIDILTNEIKFFGLDFAKTKPNLMASLSVFNSFKDKIPNFDILKQANSDYGTYDMDRKNHKVIEDVKNILKADSCTNTLYYSKGSFINWHTNSDFPGTRSYIIYTTKPGIFRYKDQKTGNIIDDIDYVGWTQRTFEVDENNLLWHCVYSPSFRFSYGFNKK
jgi:hypothetical protein